LYSLFTPGTFIVTLLVTEGYTFTLGQTYLRQESPKGELGCYIVHGQTTHPCRVSIRAPDYANLQAVHVLSTDHYIADLIATLGTADIVLGSVDKILTDRKVKNLKVNLNDNLSSLSIGSTEDNSQLFCLLHNGYLGVLVH
jgi:hypothetical protein